MKNRQCHTKLAEVALELEKKTMENKYTLDDTKSIQNDINELLAKYEKDTKGPAKIRVLAKEMPKYIKKILDGAARNNKEKLEKMDSEYKVRIQEMETKIGLDKQELERLQDAEKVAKNNVFFILF